MGCVQLHLVLFCLIDEFNHLKMFIYCKLKWRKCGFRFVQQNALNQI